MNNRAGSAIYVAPVELGHIDIASIGSPEVAGTIAEFRIMLQGVHSGEKLSIEFWEIDNPKKKSRRADRCLGKVSCTAQEVVATQTAFMSPLRSHTTLQNSGLLPLAHLVPSTAAPAPPAATKGQPLPMVVKFSFSGSTFYYALSQDQTHQHEGDGWGIQVRCPEIGLESDIKNIAHVRREVDQRFATYRSNEGNEVTLFHDGCTDLTGTDPLGAYRQLWEAIDKAEKFIFIADWSFYPLFRPIGDRISGDSKTNASLEDTIGMKIINWAKKNSSGVAAILTWKQFPEDPLNDNAHEILDYMNGGKRPDNLLFRASAHTTLRSTHTHHQKFAVLDQPPGPSGGKRMIKVFFGGLDLTKGRFDCPAHPILATECPGYQQPVQTPNYADTRVIVDKLSGVTTIVPSKGFKIDDWYNPEFDHDLSTPRQPWHDIHCSLTGAAGWDFVREFVGRWGCDPGWWSKGDKPGLISTGPAVDLVDKMFRSLFATDSNLRQQWDHTPEEPRQMWVAQVYRSILKEHWDHSSKHELATIEISSKSEEQRSVGHKIELKWSEEIKQDFENSIQHAYRQAIQQADRFIYIENQYFIGSGASWDDNANDTIQNDIPRQLVKRIIERNASKAPFHVYIIMPMYPEGSPVSVKFVPVRDYEWKTIEWMVQQLQSQGIEWKDYLSFYFPAQWHTVPPENIQTGNRKERVAGNKRYMIYVHSKFMIVDDRYFILGSANLNERSQAGNRDSEIACGFWPAAGREDDCIAELQNFRKALWVEHLGDAIPANWTDPGSIACSNAVQQVAKTNYLEFRQCRASSKKGHLCTIPLKYNLISKKLDVLEERRSIDNSILLPDSPDEVQDSETNTASQNAHFWGWNPSSQTFDSLKAVVTHIIQDISTATE
jgi:phosphatidylserine/phosphatidylglycerophosphate/cardiolipin synthase-like enzyme